MREVSAAPADPTVCDTVTLAVAGTLPDDCHTLRGMRVSPPELLPTMGPIPTYRIRARVIVEEPNPMLGRPCVLVVQPYKETAPLGTLPFGTYWVEATEYLYPFPADSTAPVDSNRVVFTFHVAPDSCGPGGACYLLDFAPADPTIPRLDGCTATISPGDRFCFDVKLENPAPVGGVQTEITVGVPREEFWFQDYFDPVAVTAAPRAAGFDVSWVAQDSTVKIILYSPTGAVLSPGRGPVLHVCYQSNPATNAVRYPIRPGPTVIATPDGGILEPCPTFAPIEGSVCVRGATCDVNGDGIGDIRDILRIVRCALAAPGIDQEVCPDSIRGRADCDGDGSVDVRDVICCVRKILRGGTFGAQPPSGGTPSDAVRFGFENDVRWITPLEGAATILIEPGASFGGIQWILDPGPAARIRDVALADPQGAYAADSWIEPLTGRARIVVYDRGFTTASSKSNRNADAAGTVSVRVTLEPTAATATGGILAMRQWTSASRDGGDLVESIPLKSSAAIPSNAAAATPGVLPARPNPFVAGTEIAYSLPAPARISLRVYDVRGRGVRTLASGPADAGVHRVRWDGRDDRGRSVGSGVYFVRYEALGSVRTQRLLRLR